jgi:dihydroxyacetone kinase
MKKLRLEVQKCLKSLQPGAHGVFDLFDDIFIAFYNITDNEFDYICEQAKDDEIAILVNALGKVNDNEFTTAPFSVRRNSLELRNFYIRKFSNLE